MIMSPSDAASASSQSARPAAQSDGGALHAALCDFQTARWQEGLQK
jgi:hypothetical protein